MIFLFVKDWGVNWGWKKYFLKKKKWKKYFLKKKSESNDFKLCDGVLFLFLLYYFISVFKLLVGIVV